MSTTYDPLTYAYNETWPKPNINQKYLHSTHNINCHITNNPLHNCQCNYVNGLLKNKSIFTLQKRSSVDRFYFNEHFSKKKNLVKCCNRMSSCLWQLFILNGKFWVKFLIPSVNRKRAQNQVLYWCND